MPDIKKGIPQDKITNYLGEILTVDLKNHHKIKGILTFYHLTEQMIHLAEWREYDSQDNLVRQGKFMVVNRTAWFQLYKD